MSVLKTFGSIRTRLLALLLLLVAGSFGLISHKIYNDSVHEVRELFDAQLSQTARLLMGLVRHDLSDSERREMQAVPTTIHIWTATYASACSTEQKTTSVAMVYQRTES